MASQLEINELVRRFRERSLLPSDWTHEAHLTVGLWHVQNFGAAEAMSRLRTGISQLNETHGNSNTPNSGYHETITRAYVELLAQFIGQYANDRSLDQILNDLLASPLSHRNALLTFYSCDYLFSASARLAWTEPDIAPLSLAALLPPTTF